MARVLIVNNLQNDFMPGGALGVSDSDSVIPVINSLQKKFTHIVGVRDWHPAGHISFAKSHGLKPGEQLFVDNYSQLLWPIHCVQGSWGAQFVHDWNTHKVRRMFDKGKEPMVDSYGCFLDNLRKESTGLSEYLTQQGVTEVYLAGMATDYCIRHAALDAKHLGYKTHVVVDACRGIERVRGEVAAALDEMQAGGIRLLSAAQVTAEQRPADFT